MQAIRHVSYEFLQRWEDTSVTIFLYFHGCGTWGAGKDNLEYVMISLLSALPLCGTDCTVSLGNAACETM